MKNVTRKTTGVVIGRFYPLHKGHNFLIETALAKVDQLSVIVGYTKPKKGRGQIITGRKRAEWIRAIHPEIYRVHVVDDKEDVNDPRIWAENAKRLLGYIPDFVFSSEDYGVPFAEALGSKHILVDQARKTVPISGTKIRTNPIAHLDFLDPIVRGFFVKRVAIVGAESSGKTTLAKDLAEVFKTNWVPEYGRTYAEGKLFNNYGEWQSSEFLHIAKKQNELEDELAQTANKVLLCDTNAFATAIWHERYMGSVSAEVTKIARNRKYDLVIVTDASIPFEQDGTRDGEHIRSWMQERFITELENQHIPYLFLTGSRKQRLAKAIKAVTPLFSQSFFDLERKDV